MPARAIRHLPMLVLTAALMAGGAGWARAQDGRMERTVTVSATGTATAEPDMARISSGVTSEAATAREALDRNSQAMAKLVSGLKSGGIDANDIQTSGFHVEPRYTRPREGQAPSIDGYRVTNQVVVVVRDLDRLGEVLDALVGTGANQMGGLAFEVSKAETLRDEARSAAITNALRRAKLLAAAAGAEVGEVMTIAEDVSGPIAYAAPAARMTAAEAVPIERGTATFEARVTVTWRLQ